MSEHIVKDQIFIRKLTEIILANLGDETFGVKELVHEAGISNYSLTRRLYSITNKTIKQFIREVRLQRALEMLQNEELTISEVAYKTGFGSPAYFNTCFHGFFGFPPGEIKKVDFVNKKEIDSVQVAQKQKQKKHALRTFLLVSSGIMVFAVLAYLGYSVFIKNPSNNTGIYVYSPAKSIAVLPFKNLSDTAINQYLIDGVREEILTNLSRIHEISVISRISDGQFHKSTKSTSEIAKNLNVDYIIEGSGQKYGTTFLLRVQLIDASQDRQIWAESYKQEIKEVKDIFGIQSRIAQAIAKELRANITPEEKQLIEKVPTANLTAYDYYLRGFQELWKFGLTSGTPESVKRAEILFKKALEIDSAFSRGYVGLAHIYWKKAYFEENYSKNFLDSMLLLANLALSFDEQLVEAYFVRGGYYSEKGNTKKATEEYDKAIKINPNYWQAYQGKGWLPVADFKSRIENFLKAASLNRGAELTELLTIVGDMFAQTGFPEKAKYYYLEALNLHGDSIRYLSNLFLLEHKQGNYNKALELLEKIDAIDSTYVIRDRWFALTYMFTGQYEKSLKYLEKWIASGLPIFNTYDMDDIGYIYWVNGNKKEAKYFFDKQIEYCLERLNKPVPVMDARNITTDARCTLATVYAFIGDKDKVYENLKIFNRWKRAELSILMLLKNKPLFDIIRNEPEFQKIVRDVEARYQAEHERVRKWLEEQGTLK